MACPTFEIADLVGKKWTVVLLQEVKLNGDKGFNFISERMQKISPKILSRRLSQLEDAGIIKRELLKTVPVKSKYRLTQKGKTLDKVITGLREWNSLYNNAPIDCSKNECVKCALYQASS